MSDHDGYEADIPIGLATAAHAGTSHVPDERGSQERASYAAQMSADHAALARLATTDEKRAILAEEWARYRAGARARATAYLAARGRCMSTMITGPSRFPTERNRKRNATADKRMGEMIDHRERALAAIRKRLTPELAPIMSGDDDAITRLRAKLAALTAERAHEKAANAAVRKAAKALGRPATLADYLAIIAGLAAPDAINGYLERSARAFPGFVPQFGPNTGAQIRDVEKRIAALTVAKATPDAATEAHGGIRIEESAADNRVRIYFPGKPAADVRQRLKASGFRWSPTIGAWQAYLNHQTLIAARNLTGATPTTFAAAACACHRGSTCDVAHDPATCGCGRCADPGPVEDGSARDAADWGGDA